MLMLLIQWNIGDL